MVNGHQSDKQTYMSTLWLTRAITKELIVDLTPVKKSKNVIVGPNRMFENKSTNFEASPHKKSNLIGVFSLSGWKLPCICIHSILNIVKCTVYSIQYTMYNAQGRVYITYNMCTQQSLYMYTDTICQLYFCRRPNTTDPIQKHLYYSKHIWLSPFGRGVQKRGKTRVSVGRGTKVKRNSLS